MKLTTEQIQEHNKKLKKSHASAISRLGEQLERRNKNVESIVNRLADYQVAIPSWALGAGGTRFGRFPIGGEPGSLEEKIEDVGLLHALNGSSGAISLHVPWDIPENTQAIKQLAEEHDLLFDAVNSNTFQDQNGQRHSYKYGSLSHTDPAVRQQAVNHNIDVIRQGESLGSRALTVWLADGSNFPGQQDFKGAFRRTLESLRQIYEHLPPGWEMLVEYKPYEPNFYSMVIPDWGTSYLFASKLGEKASTLVDLGHHLPNTNIEQIVAMLMMEEKLGGFHFNDSKYGDDDLTVGAIKPFQLFLIFSELIDGMNQYELEPAWMIDASHNVKDPLEDLLQSVEAIQTAYAKALLIDRNNLNECRETNDPAMAREILQEAYQTDVRPLLREARIRRNAAAEPIQLYRLLDVRKTLIRERGTDSVATGL